MYLVLREHVKINYCDDYYTESFNIKMLYNLFNLTIPFN